MLVSLSLELGIGLWYGEEMRRKEKGLEKGGKGSNQEF